MINLREKLKNYMQDLKKTEMKTVIKKF